MHKMPGLIDWATGKVPWAKCLSSPSLSLALFLSLDVYCPLAISCSHGPAKSVQIPELQHLLTSASVSILIPTVLGVRKVICILPGMFSGNGAVLNLSHLLLFLASFSSSHPSNHFHVSQPHKLLLILLVSYHLSFLPSHTSI